MVQILKFFFVLFFGSIILISCSTPQYRVYREGHFRFGVIVAPERVIISCEDVQDPEEKIDPKGRYGFMMLVLDLKNTVTTFVQFRVSDRSECLGRMETLERLKKKAKWFYVAGEGDRSIDPKIKPSTHLFPGLGTFDANRMVYDFQAFKSDTGECFTALYDDGKPCPKVEFFPELQTIFEN